MSFFGRKNNHYYRDVYSQKSRYRGNNKGRISGWPYMLLCLAVVGGLLLISSLGFAKLWSTFDKMINQPFPGFENAVLSLIFFTNGWSLILYIANAIADIFLVTLIVRHWHVANIGRDPKNLNTHRGDAHIMLPQKLPSVSGFGIEPDAGMWSHGPQPSALLGHLPITNGDFFHHLGHVMIAKRYKHNTKYTDSFGETVVKHKGDYVRDKDGDLIMESKPMIDENFSQALLTTSFVPKDKEYRFHYDPFKLMYNPQKAPGKRNFKTVGEAINHDWTLPAGEVQRPGGMYVVDVQPDNTMVLAMTRAGKGQTIIEPTIDMWTRQYHKWNVVVNDPKGELYVEFYYPATKRGYQVIAFNLINERHTSIYNPLGYAVEANRQGDSQKAGRFIASIGAIFFPVTKGEDPMWAEAANAAFKRSALGLIDFYQDEDDAMRDRAAKEHWNSSVLSQRLDKLWGHVTLYNVYQMMTKLASKKSDDIGEVPTKKTPPDEAAKDMKDLGFICLTPKEKKMLMKDQANGQDISKDYLTLFFDALQRLPKNSLREAAINQDNDLRSMAKSEKTLSSVYGIALTGMSFFTQDTISKLTSGRPSQNFDMEGLGFPRRIQVRLSHDYATRHALSGGDFKWDAFHDVHFTKPYKGPDFEHEGSVDVHGWISFIFKGKFDNEPAYLRLRIYDHHSHLIIKTFYFQFTKSYKKSINGVAYVEDPVNHQKIVQGGTLREMQKVRSHYKVVNGHKVPVQGGDFKFGTTTYRKRRISLVKPKGDDSHHFKHHIQALKAFSQVNIHYSEKPKMVFFITPPHMSEYAKIILILLDQMFNVQVSRSYLTKKNQKPLYGTNYMLDEVGNLKSHGKGIPNLQMKESIGLGQDQRYTLILQTVQQLKDLYGNSIDKVLQGNTKNIIYLKSTDDSMIKLLSSMSGKTHVTVRDSINYHMNADKVAGKTAPQIGSGWNVKEVPLISPNDFQLIKPDSSIVIGHGNPIWNQAQCALPMSWRLLKRQNSMHQYSLGTVPSTINNDNFDVLQNQPRFTEMVKKRVRQARLAPVMRKRYKEAHNLTDDDLAQMNIEVLSKELMQNINAQLRYNAKEAKAETKKAKANSQRQAELKKAFGDPGLEKAQAMYLLSSKKNDKDNGEQINADFVNSVNDNNSKKAKYYKKRFAGGRLAQTDFFPVYYDQGEKEWLLNTRKPSHEYDADLIRAYLRSKAAFASSPYFQVIGHSTLTMTKDSTPLIVSAKDSGRYSETQKIQKDKDKIKDAANNPGNSTVTSFGKENKDNNSILDEYIVTDEFIRYVGTKDTWNNIAGGQFEHMAAEVVQQDMESK